MLRSLLGRHTLTGVILGETETGDEWGVQYHWLCAPIKFIARRGILFEFGNEARLFDVEINGDGRRRLSSNCA
jgi:hypothetical protein